MAASGFTPIQLYRTSTPSATPTAGNLADGELAINTADGKLFYKDSGGVVQTIANKNNTGTVTSVSFTGGIISVANGTTTPALTVAGTSGGIPYFSSASTWATSAALAANALVIGGGAGAAPSTTTTGTGVLTALGTAVGSAGAFVVNGGALGTPSSGTLTNATGLPLTTGVTGTLPVGNGGTGTATAFTAGSVVFAGASGVYSQSNANFFWDNSNSNLGIGTNSPSYRVHVSAPSGVQGFFKASTAGSSYIRVDESAGGLQSIFGTDATAGFCGMLSNNDFTFRTNNTERARITAAGFTRPVAYADTVVAVGNTGTAATINLQSGNVFTATLTGNCTFTLSNPIATGSSSFTLILTNDGTAGRTVAWSGGSFVFPGGAASLSRTTTANAVDVWVFFTPNGGTTWYGNIAMKDMKA